MNFQLPTARTIPNQYEYMYRHVVYIFSDSDAWAVTIKTLAEPDSPLTNLQTLLKHLEAKLSKCAAATGFKKSSKSLLWPFSSKKTEEAVRAVERQKSLLALALENDHILLSQEIRNETAALHTGVREI